MKKLFGIRLIVYIVYSLLFFALILYMDTIPDHSDGTSDYSIWRVWLYFPVLFVYHGLMSKVILRGYKFYIPLAVTAVLGFLEALVTKTNTAVLFFDAFENSSPVVSALGVSAYYVVFSAVGMLLMNTFRFLYISVKTIYYINKD